MPIHPDFIITVFKKLFNNLSEKHPQLKSFGWKQVPCNIKNVTKEYLQEKLGYTTGDTVLLYDYMCFGILKKCIDGPIECHEEVMNEIYILFETLTNHKAFQDWGYCEVTFYKTNISIKSL